MPNKNTEEKKSRVSFIFDPNVYLKFTKLCSHEMRKYSNVVERIIENYVKSRTS